MKRRGFLAGLATAAVATVVPIPKVVASSGTITGRWTMIPMHRHQIKALMYARAYGADNNTLARISHQYGWPTPDFAKIEAQVAANIMAGGDPYAVAT